MHIGLFCYDFPPVNRVGAYRVYSFARHWSAMGHEVTVLTIAPISGVAEVRPMSDFPGLDSVRIIRVPLLGAADQGAATARGQALGGVKGLVRGVYRRFVKGRRVGFLADPSLVIVRSLLREFVKVHEESPLEVILTSFPSPGAIVLGWLMKLQTGVPWVADFRDLWAGGHQYPASGVLGLMQGWAESTMLNRADLVVAVNDRHKEIFSGRCRTPVISVPNGFELDDYLSIAPKRLGESGEVSIVYTGSEGVSSSSCVNP
jgi:glycosyltransferase involved in cell wall biosynthesis